jgi:hypothetical protein
MHSLHMDKVLLAEPLLDQEIIKTRKEKMT